MYHVKPIHQSISIKDLPSCMYKMKNPCTSNMLNEDQASLSLPAAAMALMKRQDDIIARLEALQARVSTLMHSSSKASSDHQSSHKVQDVTLPTSSKASSDHQSSHKVQDVTLPKDLVIACNPSVGPLAVLHLIKRLASRYNLLLTYYIHSSAKLPPGVDLSNMGFQSSSAGVSRVDKQMIVTWIWKDCEGCEMLVSPVKQTKIENEVNICRYLTRLLGEYPKDPVAATLMDQWLDVATAISSGTAEQKTAGLSKLAKHLSKSSNIAHNGIGIEDVVNYSAFTSSVTSGKWANDANFKKWSESVRSSFNL